MIEKFTIPSAEALSDGLQTRKLDWGQIVALPDEQFAAFHLELMEEYRDHDGWWSTPNKTPRCFSCHQVIQNPSQLRRYTGRSLHPGCFKEIHREERSGEPIFWRNYFDRVAELKS